MRIIPLILVASLGALFWMPTVQGQEPAPAVTVSHPLEREVTGYEEFAGVTEAQSVDLRPRLTGALIRVSAEEGSLVKAGDLLFELDGRSLLAVVDQTAAELAKAKAQLQYATILLVRTKKLLADKSVELEEVQLAEAERDKCEADVVAAKARHEAARLQLEQTRIVAPFSGRLGRQTLSVGSAATPETVLATLVTLDPLGVRFAIDEKAYLAMESRGRTDREPPKLLVAFADEDTFAHQGVVHGIDNRFDARSGTVLLRGKLANTGRQILPGMSARIRMTTSEPHRAIVVPDWSVSRDANGPYVLVVDAKNVLVRQSVKLGPRHDRWQEIQSGLTTKDRLVTAQSNEARREGTKVEPQLVPLQDRP